MGGAPTPIQQACPAQCFDSSADTGDGAPGGVVGTQPLHVGGTQRRPVAERGRPPAWYHDQVAGMQVRPLDVCGQRQALGAVHLVPLGDVTEPVVLSEIRRSTEYLGGSCHVEQVDSGEQEEYDTAHVADAPGSASSSATVAIRANRSHRTASVRSMIASALSPP